MSAGKALVVDANILIRAALGRRVRSLLNRYEESTDFYAPDVCFDDAREYVEQILNQRGSGADLGLQVIRQIELLVEPVDRSLYVEMEGPARERISVRDPDDWPIIAVALLLEAPIWTEDRDFFGSGLAVWTTDRIEIYLRYRQAGPQQMAFGK